MTASIGHDERSQGFTLVELLIAIVLLGLVMIALTSAMIVAFRTIDSSRQTVTDSAGAQLLSAYLVTDVQSADQVMPSLPASCPAPDAGSDVLDLSWQDAASRAAGTSPIPTTYVLYRTETDGDTTRLARYSYSVDTTGTCSQDSHKTMVAAVANATCTSPCTVAATTLGINVTAKSLQPKTGFYSQYDFTLTGTRRAS